MVQIIPQSVDKLWNEWDVRVMVLSSLCLQIVLILLGSRRKFSTQSWVRILTWTAYLSADWFATVALGMISTFQGDGLQNSLTPNSAQGSSSNPNSPAIMAFWAPFLLVHLGGPDTITAYSLEDNELWLRHLLGLLVQVSAALYIFLRSWTSSSLPLSLLAIPMFVVGIIKYGERTWALWSASSERLRESLPPITAALTPFKNENHESSGRVRLNYAAAIRKATHIQEGHALFKLFRHFYTDQIIEQKDVQLSDTMIQDHSFGDVFKLIEIEIGFMYDVLYTKAIVVHSLTGVMFRAISLVCYISTFTVFCFIIDKKIYLTIDVDLTYFLCAGAIALEIYAIFVQVSTDWTLYWLSKQERPLAYTIYQAISSFRSNLSLEKRWSESMGQFNVIEFCFKLKPPKCTGIPRFLAIYEMYSKHQHTVLEGVPIKMKQLIFEHLQDAKLVVDNAEQNSKFQVRSQVLTWRGEHAVEKSGCTDKYVKHCAANEVPFETSIALWHVATDICFYNDVDKNQKASDPNSKSKVSKLLSDYMMYILAICPFMLPQGIGQILFRQICESATTFFDERRETISKTERLVGKSASQVLYEMKSELNPRLDEFESGDGGKLNNVVLLEGCVLAHKLQALETEESWTSEDKWGMISRVWIEMLCYAASQCGWTEHGQQLRRGGELLTHVSLLMANLGIGEQSKILSEQDMDRLQDLKNLCEKF
ncbi:uncharacterized protein LOC133730387 [Rosa rugosa]|uniref:uncharacterized protein LOC133730387 n=1 Tax=Rosa rugosa TaxID=74645 RepID=UPI002B408B45|nr:uncharacterized protein LOC133730387 [Rosa rugosa]